MTTVVALAQKAGVWMSADTGTNVFDRPVGGMRKIRTLYDAAGLPVALLGFSGPGAAINVLMAEFAAEPLTAVGNKDPDLWAYAVAARMTRAMVDAGLIDQETGQMDGVMLLGVPGHVWTLDHHLAVRSPDGIGAVGSGEGPGIGALDAFVSCGVPPSEAVQRAARIAVCRDRWSRLPMQHEFLAAAVVPQA